MSEGPHFNREDLISEFWQGVRGRVIDVHGRAPDQADLGIGRYRLDTERRGLGDAVYNQGIERAAEIVDGVVEFGLPGQSEPRLDRRFPG